jgi:hypothetical protein
MSRLPCTFGMRVALPATTTGVSHAPTRSGSLLTLVGCSSWVGPTTPCQSSICGRQSKPRQTVNRTIAAGAYEHIYMHPDQDHLKGVQLPKAGPILQVSAELPFDLSRSNQPITDTRTQRRN